MAEPEFDDEKPARGLPVWVWVLLVLVVVLPGACVGIGLLATLVMPSVIQKTFDAETMRAKADVLIIENALDQYAIENQGNYPADLDVLLVEDEHGLAFLDGGEDALLDPWGNRYLYEPPGDEIPRPRVTSLGADGLPGGEGKDRDIDTEKIRNGDF